MSPVEIRMLMHFYAIPGRYEGPEYGSSAWDNAIRNFQNQGLIKPMATTAGQIELTDKGTIYVEMLTSLPLPEKQCMWVSERKEIMRPVTED